MVCMKLLEQTELLMTLSSVTFTIKHKSQEKKELIFLDTRMDFLQSIPSCSFLLVQLFQTQKDYFHLKTQLHKLSDRLCTSYPARHNMHTIIPIG